MNVLERIRQVYPELTKSQKRLADYVATSYREAAFMTASRLAKHLALNEATVIRFSQRLGYPGYPQLIEDVQAVVRSELEVGGAQDAAQASAYATTLAVLSDNLTRSLSHIAANIVESIVERIRSADRVAIVGQGFAAPLAQLLAMRLRSMGLRCEAPNCDPLSLAMALGDFGPGTVAIGVSVPPSGTVTADALVYVADRGAFTIAVAWSPVCPTSQVADLALSYPAVEALEQYPSAPIVMLFDMLLERLAAELGDVRGPSSADLQRRVERLAGARRTRPSS